MKKVLLAKGLQYLFMEKSSFLDRADIQVFIAASNGEMLKIHRKEAVDLIITELDMPGISSEDLFSTIRKWKELRGVSSIIICEDTLAHRERCKQCRANAVFPIPVDPAMLHLKVQQFLNVAPRMSYRTAIAVAISGKFKNRPVPFRTENISASGMLIAATEPLTKGDGIFFSFFLPHGEHVSGYGEIVRIERGAGEQKSFLYGVRFTNIEPAAKAAIDAVIDRAKRR
ncbi:MAG TPA: PilZ domain-containing protein [Nitrospirota bacterium]|nr:PilZ domain-containing protein [Nitrospirota bacterium]